MCWFTVLILNSGPIRGYHWKGIFYLRGLNQLHIDNLVGGSSCRVDEGCSSVSEMSLHIYSSELKRMSFQVRMLARSLDQHGPPSAINSVSLCDM